MKRTTRLGIRLVACALLLFTSTSRSSVTGIEVRSSAVFSSAIIAPPPVGAGAAASSLAAWNALGRHAVASTGVIPTGSIFAQDHAEAWGDFQQIDAGSRRRAFAQLSGYYLDSGGLSVNHAYTAITIFNQVTIVNTTDSRVEITLLHPTHGTLLAGGYSNFLTASATEELTIYQRGPLPTPTTPITLVHTFGTASVFADQSTPTITVAGDWVGKTTEITRNVASFADPFQGIEISDIGKDLVGPVDPHTIKDVFVEFQGYYEVRPDPLRSGFLSMGQVDFGGTGEIIFAAEDIATGLPIAGVNFNLASITAVPEPSTVLSLLVGLPLVAARVVAQRRQKRK